MAFEFIKQQLDQRRQAGLFRTRRVLSACDGAMIEVDGQHYLNFSSNDYLGQRQNIKILQSWVEGLSLFGAGSGASPLVTGHTQAHQDLEDYLAENLQREKVLLFNSGFAANQAICQALAHESMTILSDKLMHASFIEGAMHSKAKFKRFKHNDIEHAKALLAEREGDTLLATEGIFSMDGDAGELISLASLASDSDAWLLVDDAHGFGVTGQYGLGSIEALGLSQQQVPILMATFGKAVGTGGAFVAGSADLIDYLINFAKHYIYSTAMPPAMARATLTSLQTLRDGQQQAKLQTHIKDFKRLCLQANISLLSSDSAIQPILIGDPQHCLSISEQLKNLGIWVTAIRFPTVPKGQDRLRITLSTDHTPQDIAALVDALQIVLTTSSMQGEN
ncbi:8-amino-7-oxononanoate synthase [Aliiglaciecola sp. LCG003]|uniref:aminotransferase class I/II-fold pyridoxal phosphate-dependent enzyme n=1 Tax=Aliiglaciecola sp. LCG003 TaxID=3053655 RepID=UPI00257267D2|nr:8-amino-7-oxononanoate synthase [Aliiglaciecola sp. LCG003]WJG08056.1 8-amino-7-oxononanoate synthase [Aliiglaciecola sp. LCG003]